jgi:hypothetical protein
MSKLHNQLSAMQKKNDVLENKNAKLGSPDATTEQSQRIDAAMYVPCGTACGSGGGESSGGSGDGTTSKSVAPKRLAKNFEQGGGAIGAKKAKTGSTEDVTIAVLLSTLSVRGRLEHLEKWKNINLHNNEFGHRWWPMNLDKSVVKHIFCLTAVVQLRRVDHRWWGAHLENPVVKHAVFRGQK